MEADSTSETSGHFYHTMWCHISQDMIFINTTVTTYQYNAHREKWNRSKKRWSRAGCSKKRKNLVLR